MSMYDFLKGRLDEIMDRQDKGWYCAMDTLLEEIKDALEKIDPSSEYIVQEWSNDD